jgi:hypothetical protein
MKWPRRRPVPPPVATWRAWARVAVWLAIALPLALVEWQFALNEVGSGSLAESRTSSPPEPFRLEPAPRPDPLLSQSLTLRHIATVAGADIRGYEFLPADQAHRLPRLAVLDGKALIVAEADGEQQRVTVSFPPTDQPSDQPPGPAWDGPRRMHDLRLPDGRRRLLAWRDGAIHAIDVDNGTIEWSHPVESSARVMVHPLAGGEDGIFITTTAGQGLVLLDALGNKLAETDPQVPLPGSLELLWSPIAWPDTPESIVLLAGMGKRLLLRVEDGRLTWRAVKEEVTFHGVNPTNATSSLLAPPGTHEVRRPIDLRARRSSFAERYPYAPGTEVVPVTTMRQAMVGIEGRAISMGPNFMAPSLQRYEVVDERGGRVAHLSTNPLALIAFGGVHDTIAHTSPDVVVHVSARMLEYQGVARSLEHPDGVDGMWVLEPGQQPANLRLFMLPDGMLLALGTRGTAPAVVLYRLRTGEPQP